ncbi:MAG: hypothetical protein U1D97_04110, partial [Desulfuromonadales bacterium]|nr:hypothetical protein [Desulfuromonadales bacterium]
YSSDEIRRYIIINKVIAYKYGGKDEEALTILNQEDWSSCADKYLLAVSVLKNEFNKAVQIMKRIGDSDKSINIWAYREWPLFKEFRKTNEFIEAYKEIFKEEFVITEKVMPEIESECKITEKTILTETIDEATII